MTLDAIFPRSSFNTKFSSLNLLNNLKFKGHGVGHLNFKLSPFDEEIGLYQLLDQNIRVIDTIKYAIDTRNISFGRYPDSKENMYVFDISTPGEANFIDVSIEMDKHNSGFKVYPNPSDGIIYIDADHTNESRGHESILQILGVDGELLKSISLRSTLSLHRPYELDLSELPPGMYFIKYIEQETVITQKIVIR